MYCDQGYITHKKMELKMQNKSIISLIRQRVFKSPRAMQMELFLYNYFNFQTIPSFEP
jgi:hypothetical protein